MIRLFLTLLCFTFIIPTTFAQESPSGETTESGENATQAETANPNDSPEYPIMVAVDGDDVYSVDLNWPGVWKTTGDQRQVFIRGSEFLRKPMNRPRAITIHPEIGILVGCSPTREIYHVKPGDTGGTPLNGGYLGNVMALAVSPDGKTIYAGDTERRALYRLPIEGGKPELVAQVNPRGLAFMDEKTVVAVTPDADAVVKIDVESGETTTLIGDRPYQFPGDLVWADGVGYVSDVYGKCIWEFNAEGETSKWFEGDPLARPVGLALDNDSLYVSDPSLKQVFLINRKDKSVKPLWTE